MQTPSLNLSIPAGDYVNHMMTVIFGPIWNAVANSNLHLGPINAASGGTFGPAFMIYNGAVFTLTTFYIVKVIFEGVAGTAYHGEWLGKSFHTFWTPMRIVVMLALIAPVSSGYSISQIVVLWTSAQAVGAADSVANAMVSTIVKQGAIANAQSAPSAKAVASNVLRTLVCAATIDDKVNGNGNLIVSKAVKKKGMVGVRFGGASGSGLPPDACGAYYVKSGNRAAQTGVVEGVNAMLPLLTPVAKAIVKQTLSPSSPSGPTGNQGGSKSTIPENQVSIAAQVYTDKIQAAVATYQAKQNHGVTSKWKAALKHHGFGALGGFLIDITSWDRAIADLNNAQPLVSAPNYNELQSGYGLKQTEAAANAYISNDNPLGAGASKSLNKTLSVPAPSKNGGGIVARMLEKPLTHMNGFITSTFMGLTSSVTDPIGQIQKVGLAIIGVALGIYATSVLGVALVGAGTGNWLTQLASGGSSSLIAKLTFGLVKPAILLIVATPLFLGATLAYIIPALMYILYTMAVIGWCAAVFAATTGAPLWAAIHAIPGQEEGLVPNAARSGYNILLSLFAKPSLIVFGFFGAIVLFSAGVYLVNETFVFATNSIVSASFSGGNVQSIAAIMGSFLSIICFLIIYTLIIWKLAEWTFGMVHSIPDHALQWMGLQDMSMSEERTHHDVYAGFSSSTHHTGGAFKPADVKAAAQDKLEEEQGKAEDGRSKEMEGGDAGSPKGD